MIGLSGAVAGQLQDARGYSDEDFRRAIEEGVIFQLLKELPVEVETFGHNQVQNPLSAKFFYLYFAGMPNPGYRPQYDGFAFSRAYLTQDTTQQDWTQGGDVGYLGWNGGPGIISPITGNVSRYFGAVNSIGLVEEKRINEEANTPTGLRATHVTHTFLWLPSDANAPNIRGMRILTQDTTTTTDTSAHYWNQVMQHRFVDSAGTPITIAKNSDQTFCVRWTLTYKSI
jgi:hypothetical protein